MSLQGFSNLNSYSETKVHHCVSTQGTPVPNDKVPGHSGTAPVAKRARFEKENQRDKLMM